MDKNRPKTSNKLLYFFKTFLCFYYFLIIAFALGLSGCTNVRMPLTVTFVDVSGAMSADHTIQIKVAEEKDFQDKYLDILIKSDTDGVELTLFKEFDKEEDKIKIKLNKDTGYLSLDEYGIFNLESEQGDSMVGYGDVLATNLVINSNKDATLTLVAKVGDKEQGTFKEIGTVSSEYTLKVKKKVQD